jgi:hypothetical protein
VDPYDPYRVWVDVRSSGTTLDGVYVDAPPQAFSFTFDDEGFCTRLTAGAVMDPSIGEFLSFVWKVQQSMCLTQSRMHYRKYGWTVRL